MKRQFFCGLFWSTRKKRFVISRLVIILVLVITFSLLYSTLLDGNSHDSDNYRVSHD